jgi:hypothetical protein
LNSMPIRLSHFSREIPLGVHLGQSESPGPEAPGTSTIRLLGFVDAVESARANLLLVAVSELPSDAPEVVQAWYVINSSALAAASQVKQLRQALSSADAARDHLVRGWMSRIQTGIRSIASAMVVLDAFSRSAAVVVPGWQRDSYRAWRAYLSSFTALCGEVRMSDPEMRY